MVMLHVSMGNVGVNQVCREVERMVLRLKKVTARFEVQWWWHSILE